MSTGAYSVGRTRWYSTTMSNAIAHRPKPTLCFAASCWVIIYGNRASQVMITPHDFVVEPLPWQASVAQWVGGWVSRGGRGAVGMVPFQTPMSPRLNHNGTCNNHSVRQEPTGPTP